MKYDANLSLSKNFKLSEFVKSPTASRLGIKNIPNSEVCGNLSILVAKLLQPLRDIYGLPMYVSSGYRCESLNRAVGGVKNSLHRLGKASDISVGNPRKLLRVLANSKLEFDQAILYEDGRNNFLHLSYNSGRNRGQILYSRGTVSGY